MRRLLNRQVAGVLVMSLLLVLAGCNGGGGPATETDQSDGPPSAGQFTEGEMYKYNFSFGQMGSSEITWDVTSVDGDNVTVNVTTVSQQRTSSTEISGASDEIYSKALQQPSTALFVALGYLPVAFTQDRDLSQGNTFTVSQSDIDLDMPQQSTSAAKFDVTVNGTTSVNGVDCQRITVVPQSNESAPFNACINTEYPFAVSVTSQAESGGLSLTLVDAEQP